MSQYDLVIGMGQDSVNRVVASLYARKNLRSSLFAGSQSENILGSTMEVSWSVEQAPTVSLNSPSTEQWNQAIKSDGGTSQPIDNAFMITFEKLHLSQKQADGGKALETTTSLSAICQMTIEAGKLFISPLAVIVDLSSASETDRLIYKSMIIPEVLKMAGKMLSGEQLPKISYHGLASGTPTLSVGSGRLIAVAGLTGQPAPKAPNPADFPEGQFYTLFSKNALQSIMNSGAKDMAGKSTSTSGSQGFGIGKASYNATVRINSLTASPSSHDMTKVDAKLDISASASAGISILPSFINEAGKGITTAANTVAKGTVDAANTVAKGTVDAANTVADGAKKAVDSVKHFFGHLF